MSSVVIGGENYDVGLHYLDERERQRRLAMQQQQMFLENQYRQQALGLQRQTAQQSNDIDWARLDAQNSQNKTTQANLDREYQAQRADALFGQDYRNRELGDQEGNTKFTQDYENRGLAQKDTEFKSGLAERTQQYKDQLAEKAMKDSMDILKNNQEKELTPLVYEYKKFSDAGAIPEAEAIAAKIEGIKARHSDERTALMTKYATPGAAVASSQPPSALGGQTYMDDAGTYQAFSPRAGSDTAMSASRAAAILAAAVLPSAPLPDYRTQDPEQSAGMSARNAALWESRLGNSGGNSPTQDPEQSATMNARHAALWESRNTPAAISSPVPLTSELAAGAPGESGKSGAAQKLRTYAQVMAEKKAEQDIESQQKQADRKRSLDREDAVFANTQREQAMREEDYKQRQQDRKGLEEEKRAEKADRKAEENTAKATKELLPFAKHDNADTYAAKVEELAAKRGLSDADKQSMLELNPTMNEMLDMRKVKESSPTPIPNLLKFKAILADPTQALMMVKKGVDVNRVNAEIDKLLFAAREEAARAAIVHGADMRMANPRGPGMYSGDIRGRALPSRSNQVVTDAPAFNFAGL